MTALTADRPTPERDGLDRALPVAAAVTIHAGSLVVLNAGGYAQPGVVAANLAAVGRAEERVDNAAGSNGAAQVRVQRGIFRWANAAGGDAIDLTDVGSPCYVVDDQTVAASNGGGARSAAGTVFDVDAQGVWVITG